MNRWATPYPRPYTKRLKDVPIVVKPYSNDQTMQEISESMSGLITLPFTGINK